MIHVSIVITHHNRQHFLLPLIEYLITNTSSSSAISTEIIVVDNLSPISRNLKNLSEELCFTSKEVKICFLFLEQNYGPAYARNRAVELAQGDYIQFLDEDDWIEPNKIEEQYFFAVQQNFPSFVVSPWARVSSDSSWYRFNIISHYVPSFEEPAVLSIIRSDGFVPLMAGLVSRKSFLKVGGFREQMWLVEDVRFLIELQTIDPSFVVYSTNRPYFFYRTHQSNSLSSTNKRELFNDACYENAVRVETVLRDSSLLDAKNSRSLANIYGGLARFYFECNRTKFEEIYNRILALNPNYLPEQPLHLK